MLLESKIRFFVDERTSFALGPEHGRLFRALAQSTNAVGQSCTAFCVSHWEGEQLECSFELAGEAIREQQ